MYIKLNDGWIEVICGSMYAGKTEELLRRIRRIEYAKKDIIVFKPKIDNRYSDNEVVSHNNTRTKSYNVVDPSEIYTIVGTKLPYAIAIDEIQFFGHEILDVCNYYADRGVRVICA